MPSDQATQPLNPGVYENWHQWRRVEHGLGSVKNLGREIERLHIRRPFIVTTRSLLNSELLAQVRTACEVAVAGQFHECEPHTPRQVIMRALDLVRQAKPDGLVSFGGSTVTDTAKGIALAIAADMKDLSDFDAALAVSELEAAFLPHIALPTTLSGAEYSPYIGITNEARRKKEIFRFDGASPESVLLDPRLTLATPPRLWAATGIKVLSDAIEQLYSKAAHPIVSSLCLAAIRAFATYLPVSLSATGEALLDARLRCQIGTWQSVFAMHNAGTRVALGGALRHQLGGMFRIPHGEATCVMLPHVLRYNFPAIPDGYRALAEALRIPATADGEARLEAVVASIGKLIGNLALPDRLGPLGVKRKELPAMAEHVLQESSLAVNPRPVTSANELVRILEAAL